ncbi:MAG: tellurite resistance protein TerC [Verrucomicrobiota bacterium]|jgi:tellurite resistance protein TerC
MPPAAAVPVWQWGAFIGGVLAFVLLDLFVFHRGARPVTMRNALFWTLVTVVLALGFAGFLIPWRGRVEATEFLTGYVIELSLSMDNVFVIALIFAYFRVPAEYQHRVLFFGFIDALVMRGAFIAIGMVVVGWFHWILYAMGGFLIFSGIKMITSKQEGVEPDKNLLIRLARRIFPVAPAFEGPRFFTRLDGRFALTPLAIVLIAVESADLVFAIDSIPAIFSITKKPFIIFTSNMFAILGLRSLYFVLVGALKYFRHLKYGLALVLVFVGLKMLGEKLRPIPPNLSLVIVAVIILLSMLASLFVSKRESAPPPPGD